MNHTAKVTAKGQITLPRRMRKALGVNPGDRITFIEDENGDFHVKASAPHGLADLRGIVKAKEPIRSEQIDQWIEEARAARQGTGSR
ncbi:MAG: AbrB/MazE/SpoVT family DNA-binding domain-containing protein [Pararhizobium sp.]